LSTQTCVRTALMRNVHGGDPIGLHCVLCHQQWEAGWHELQGIKRLLGQDAVAD